MISLAAENSGLWYNFIISTFPKALRCILLNFLYSQRNGSRNRKYSISDLKKNFSLSYGRGIMRSEPHHSFILPEIYFKL